jgi:hypothetical protein
VNESSTIEIPTQPRPARRFLPHLLAFLVTVIVSASIPLCFGFTNPFPPDALIVTTHGHNAKVMAALTEADIPTLAFIDTNDVQLGSYSDHLLSNTLYLALLLAGFFLGLFLFKRLMGPKWNQNGTSRAE